VNTWKVILATMVIFGAGVVTGGLLVRQTMPAVPSKQSHQNAINRSIPTAPGVTRVEFLRRAQRELNLSPEQREQADKIISASQERTKKIMEPVASTIRDELKQTRDQFRALLTPEQQARFDEMLKKPAHPRDPRRMPGKTEKTSGDRNVPE
jgi:Spy/CpxP family protein refolding chaperone